VQRGRAEILASARSKKFVTDQRRIALGDSLQGKVAVVTGAGAGIGHAIALALADEGAAVVVNDLGCSANGVGASSEPADAVAATIRARGGRAVPNYESVASLPGAERIIATALSEFGKLDILVNVAGTTRRGMIWELTEEDWDEVVTTHLKGTFACIRAAAPPMMAQRSGRIVNVASDIGYYGGAGRANYAAAKAGILGVTWTAALELGVFGVTVNALCPSAATRMGQAGRGFDESHPIIPPERVRVEMQRARDPADVAPIVVYLAREEAAGINGQAFRACEGQIGVFTRAQLGIVVHKEGRWTQDELSAIVPSVLTQGLTNPSPPRDVLEWPFMLQ
jgi:NAD(P)-dependent dehydrogenase (short-subunit alcohol dehydrogenase family)